MTRLLLPGPRLTFVCPQSVCYQIKLEINLTIHKQAQATLLDLMRSYDAH